MAEAGPGRGHSTWPLQSYTLIMARPGAGAGQGAEQGAGLVNRGFEGDGANVAFSPPAAAPPPEDAGAELADCSLLGLRLRPLNMLRGPRCCTVLYCTVLYCTAPRAQVLPGLPLRRGLRAGALHQRAGQRGHHHHRAEVSTGWGSAGAVLTSAH